MIHVHVWQWTLDVGAGRGSSGGMQVMTALAEERRQVERRRNGAEAHA